jgi:undecaprenyl-diphosphatase
VFELLQAIVLGIVQGATEFIPVSSSGHLVIVPWLLGWERPGLLFDTVLHWGTLISIFIVFWRDLIDITGASIRSIFRRSLADPNARLGWYIVVGTIPAAGLGLLFSDFVEDLFHSPAAAGFFLLVTALLLAGSEQMAKRMQLRKTTQTLTWTDAVIIGLAQAAALAPGISRSGSTIAAGLARNINRESAARFSFLLGTPVFLGAGLLQVGKALATDPATLYAQIPILVVGLVVSAITGFLAIRFMLSYLRNHTLYLFAGYCAVVGLLVLLPSLF